MAKSMFTVVALIGTTNSSGDKVLQSTQAVNGLLFGIHEAKGSLVDGVDMTLTVVNSNFTKTILTLTNANTDHTEYFPRCNTSGPTGTANSDNMLPHPVVGKLQLTIAQGGDTKTGGLYAYVVE